MSKPIPGVHLVKVLDDPEADKQADDVVDLVREIQRGASTDYQSAADAETEKRAEAEFFLALARKIDERLTWANGKARVTELGTRDGWHITLTDREGRPYDVQITYDALADVAVMQRCADEERGIEVMVNTIVDKLQTARQRYFERMYAVS